MSSQSNIIKHEDQLIIQLPSGNLKLVTVRSDNLIDLGKFGKFQSNDIINKPYGYSYRIEKGRAFVTKKDTDLSEVEETTANNQNLVAKQENQKLSFEEIENMKANIASGETSHSDILNAMIANHSEFNNKTEYSKAKYINRKKKKFNNIFTPLEPNHYNICKFFFDKNPSKIRELRIDTLSQILTSANIHAKSKVLVVDDTQGLIVGSIMERLAGFGKVVAIHESEFPNYDIVRYFNFPQSYQDSLFTISWDKLDENYQEPTPEKPETEEEILVKKYERKLAKFNEFNTKKGEVYEGNFDCLIISSFINPWSVISKLKRFIGPSRPIVIYNQFKEPLTATAAELMASDEFIYTQLSESWLRHHQVLPGRTHPDMSMSATGGYLLSCIKVTPNDDIQPITQSLSKRQKNNWFKS